MNKTGRLRAVLFTASAVALLAVIWIVIFIKASPKTPAAVPQVFAVLAENGLIATDLTGAYREKWSVGTALKVAVGTEKSDLRFDFFSTPQTPPNGSEGITRPSSGKTAAPPRTSRFRKAQRTSCCTP